MALIKGPVFNYTGPYFVHHNKKRVSTMKPFYYTVIKNALGVTSEFTEITPPVPKERSPVGYKVCITPILEDVGRAKLVIIKLEIPQDAEVFSINNVKDYDWFGNKSRASKAIVTKIYGGFDKVYSPCVSMLSKQFTAYVVGKTIIPDGFSRTDSVCGHGIHYFETLKNLKDWWSYYINHNLSVEGLLEIIGLEEAEQEEKQNVQN